MKNPLPLHRLAPSSLLAGALLVLAACDDPVKPDLKVSTVEIIEGDRQVGVVGAPLESAVVVRALSKRGKVLAGRPLIFRASHGGSAPGDTTDAEGRAEVVWTLGTAVGPQTLQVLLEDSAVVATIEASAGAGALAQLRVLKGEGQSGAVGETLADSLVVEALDAFGNAKPGAPVTFAVRRGGGAVSAAEVVTGADGRAAVLWRLGSESVKQELSITATGHSSAVTGRAQVRLDRPTIYLSLPDSASPGQVVPVELRIFLEGSSEVRGLLATRLKWDSGALTGPVVRRRDAAEDLASHLPAPGELSVVTTRASNDLAHEGAFVVDFVVQPGATGNVVLRVELSSLLGAATFRELSGQVTVVGGTLRIR